ncbi:DUF1176 domain-containing protein [Psychrobacter aquaticus]|uniref:DUF1176 domain-containing protein n=1 Tax=Psychrobacter aquaticus CMS 56 TaxID=1354303 RepID=U4T400_9GAMM|nr:DUF1176 domain-containing protein [Psychrobacter aquaticus]ERL55575.1 DUF1176 domain-containing protein [Psychrobacter aquaticus CMS 56]
MKKLTVLLSAMMDVLPLTSISAHAAYGTPFDGWGFVQDDWQLVCDNTLTCRAAGYAEESMLDTPASVLLTVLPKVALPTAQVQFMSQSSEDSVVNAQLWLNDKNYGTLQLVGKDSQIYDLSAKQTQQLLRHSRKNTKIEIRADADRWTISDKGMSAVLLKLDETQGRVGTPLALVSKKNPNRQIPKAAKAKPVIKKALSYSDDNKQQLDPAKLVYFQKNIHKWIDIDAKQLVGSEDEMGDCELVNPKTEAYQQMQEYGADRLDWTFTPVDAKHTLASHMCWQGAYNEGYGYWLINHDKPSKPKLITTSGNEYSDGEIWATHKDRGIGDCWNRQVWVWNGKTFAQSEESSTGMCRGFAGGAWDLLTYVSEVIENNSKANK